MHELSITESLVSAVLEQVDGEVRAVTVVIGRLSGVVPDSLRFCFDVCTRGTRLEGAVLEIIEPIGRACCRTCRLVAEVSDGIPLCACGSADLDILEGRELSVKHVEVEV